MRLLSRTGLLSLILSLSTQTALAADDTPWDCHVTISKASYDLTSIAGEHTVVAPSRNSPPSTYVDVLRFNLCAELTAVDGVPDGDQCPSGTLACMTTTNQKENADDRVVGVVPLATTSTLNPVSSLTKDKLSIILHGPTYGSESTAKSLNVIFTCLESGEDEEPTLGASDVEGMEHVFWNTKAGCAVKGDTPGNTNPPEDGVTSGGSGIGWFFLLLLLSFLAYLGLGAYYNYNNYGASGWDLVPHRDFWRDVPSLLKDVVSHLFSSVRGGRSTGGRGGYVSV